MILYTVYGFDGDESMPPNGAPLPPASWPTIPNGMAWRRSRSRDIWFRRQPRRSSRNPDLRRLVSQARGYRGPSQEGAKNFSTAC
jgi:hypothetical protein